MYLRRFAAFTRMVDELAIYLKYSNTLSLGFMGSAKLRIWPGHQSLALCSTDGLSGHAQANDGRL